MIRLFVILLLFIISSVNCILRPGEKLYLMDGEGFSAYLEVAKSFGAVQNCWFQFRDNPKIKIELNATEPVVTERGEIVLPFSSTICGIRVNKLSVASAALWTLEVESVHGDVEKDQLTIHILPAPKTRFDTHLETVSGPGTIECKQHSTYTKHCRITDNDTGESWDECNAFTTLRPNKTFECLTYNWGRMEASDEHIIVDTKNSTVFTTATLVENTSNSVLSCQFTDSIYSCKAEMPDHKNELFITEGLYSGRYSAYDTLFSKSRCSLQIPKPLDSNERGLWRIINHSSGTPRGCLFYVGMSRNETIQKELDYMGKNERVLKINTPEGTIDQHIPEIECTAPFVMSDCYLRDPNNTVYFPDDINFQIQRVFGKCSFRNIPIIAGMWLCGMRGLDYDKEVLQEIEVIVKPKRGEVLTKEVRVKKYGSVDLMCKSSFEDPISQCAFVNPQGQVYLVATKNSIKKAGHVQYFGRGLLVGECGAKITDVSAEDYGQWKCHFTTYAGRADSKFVMRLVESDIGYATSIGLGVGLTIVTLLVLGVVIGTIFYKRRNFTARHNLPSTDPLNISTSSISAIPAMATTPT